MLDVGPASSKGWLGAYPWESIEMDSEDDRDEIYIPVGPPTGVLADGDCRPNICEYFSYVDVTQVPPTGKGGFPDRCGEVVCDAEDWELSDLRTEFREPPGASCKSSPVLELLGRTHDRVHRHVDCQRAYCVQFSELAMRKRERRYWEAVRKGDT